MKGISLEKEKTWRDKKKRKRKKEEEKQPTASFFTLGYSLHPWKVREKSDTPNFFFKKAWQPPFMENQTQNSGGKEKKNKQQKKKNTRKKKSKTPCYKIHTDDKYNNAALHLNSLL